MMESTRQTITPVAWDAIVDQRIQMMCGEWNLLPVQDRFWIVFNWLTEFTIAHPANANRRLFIPKDVWQHGCTDTY